MHTHWKSFFVSLLPEAKVPAELDQVNGHIEKITVEKSGLLQIHASVDQLCPPTLLCRLENALEKELGEPEVLISQRPPAGLDQEEILSYIVDLIPWLLRHLHRQDAFTAAMLTNAEFKHNGSGIEVHLQADCCPLFERPSIEVLANLCSQYHQLKTEFTLVAVDTKQASGQAAGARISLSAAGVKEKKARTIPDQAASPKALVNSAQAQAQANRQKKGSRQEARSNKPSTYKRPPRSENMLWGRLNSQLTVTPIKDLNSEAGVVVIEGETFALESKRVSQNTRLLVKFALTDLSGSVQCLLFAKPEDEQKILSALKNAYVRLQASISFDSQYSHDLQAQISGIQKAQRPAGRIDAAEQKRVELHAHTKMSAKDATCDVADLIKQAASFGHEAIAITDHGVVQAFPDAFNTQMKLQKEGQDIKIIYGLEGYLVDDGPAVAWGHEILADGDYDLHKGFVALDVETTGLDPSRDRIIELGAVLYLPDQEGNWQAAERFETMVNAGLEVPAKITEITGITTAMSQQGIQPLEAMERLLTFIGDRALVAHNAFFDLGFLRYAGFRTDQPTDPRLKFNQPLVDTLALSRLLYPSLSSHKLGELCHFFDIPTGQQHRAGDDANACAQVLLQLLQKAKTSSLKELNQLAGKENRQQILAHKREVFHIIILASDPLGLYNLYRLISASHLDYFHGRPRIPRSLLQFFRQGLILGSACEAGELFRKLLALYQQEQGDYEKAAKALKDPALKRLCKFYDYIEIQPLSNNSFYLRDANSGLNDLEDLQNLNRLLVDLAKQNRRPVCATCDVHFLNPEDSRFREILMSDMGYADAHLQAELYLRTTDEMLAEFAYLGRETAYAAVVENPRKIAGRIQGDLRPFPAGSFPPQIASAADKIEDLTYQTAMDLYGYEGQLPSLVQERIEKELSSIIENGFAVMYYIAHKLVKKSNDDGYIVGSRGSVGSSLVATLCGISEVNPLPAHYLCPHCSYSEFDTSGNYGSGYDLPPANCPKCQRSYSLDGQDIPFETFLGFDGDKQPDIDLNFSSDYQPRAHRFIEDMFGAQHTFRAGTISSFAEKNAQGLVLSYFEKKEQFVTKAEVRRLSRGLMGIRRTTGQHPGGIVVVPKEREIFDFTPIQHPADNRTGGVITTHFDFNAMQETILKLDVLGHDNPTMLKMLGDLTGVDINSIPIPDAKVMSLFTSTEALGIPDSKSPINSATIGLPEMGTFMARDMIKETRPTQFYDLVQLMGLSHGTDVWKDNAQELIRKGVCTINDVIGCRDTIMTDLIYKGLSAKTAFDIMEKVRRGRGLTPAEEDLMRSCQVADWYIDSCKKIKYMFPKAHAAAYTISSLRIAWFKVYYPEAYYSTYFTVKGNEFNTELMVKTPAEVRIERERRRQSFRQESDKEQKMYYLLELVEEMQLRDIDFLPPDIYKSEAHEFIQEGPGLIRPALDAIPGISRAMGSAIVKARQAGEFKSKDELMTRTGLGQSAVEALANSGCLGTMPDSNQINLFEMLG